MSDINEWTNLPNGMDPDFVSYSGDYDYPLYLSEKKEWINFKNFENTKGRITISEPFLIMELNRFVPFLEDNLIKFHPLNMPNIKIGKIEILGFVMGVSEDARYYEYQVDDGTGTITIFYEKKSFAVTNQMRMKIDEKYRKNAKTIDINLLKNKECPKRFLNPRPRFNYPCGTSIRDMAIFEHNWAMETNNGLLGKYVRRCDYVHAIGYCTLDFMLGGRPQEEITFSHLSNSKLNFLANKVTCIDEHKYNAKLYSWLNTVVRKRYDESFKT
ncbi:uncharacterized protein LOC143182825 [Calliopsis andreniformis]|uniref:uncharacterized protein LOC143182825 n=1 Tax=Calliopsis andreniformis TaxID=337506 RepID=UPI003FCCF83C